MGIPELLKMRIEQERQKMTQEPLDTEQLANYLATGNPWSVAELPTAMRRWHGWEERADVLERLQRQRSSERAAGLIKSLESALTASELILRHWRR